MDQFCSSLELQAAPFNNSVSTTLTTVQASSGASVSSFNGGPLIHTTSSMPANLHLVNAPTTLLLNPTSAAESFVLPSPSPPNNLATAPRNAAGGVSFLHSSFGGGSSGSSGPLLTAGGSSCSIPASSSYSHIFQHQQENSILPMEVKSFLEITRYS